MRDVAASAGVALETVYSHFSSKKGLLRAVVDAAAVGDDMPERLAERPEFLAMGAGPRSRRIRAAAQLLVEIQLRTARLDELFQDGARSDETIAEMLSETRERRRLDVARAFELVVGRPPTVTERDGLWVLVSPEVYRLLVDASGWTVEEYQAWIAATTERVLPRS
jgi:AcrR family transcriptional regulator